MSCISTYVFSEVLNLFINPGIASMAYETILYCIESVGIRYIIFVSGKSFVKLVVLSIRIIFNLYNWLGKHVFYDEVSFTQFHNDSVG